MPHEHGGHSCFSLSCGDIFSLDGFDLAQGRDVARGVEESGEVRPQRPREEDMANSRLLWPTKEQLRRRYELMDWMMRRQGVDTKVARRVDGGLAFLEARAKCRYCLHEEECQRWLTIRAPRRSPDFCPNTTFFLTLSDRLLMTGMRARRAPRQRSKLRR